MLISSEPFNTGLGRKADAQAEDKEVRSWQRMTSCPLIEKNICLLPSICPLEHLFFEDLCLVFLPLIPAPPRLSLFGFQFHQLKRGERQASGFFFLFPLGQVFVHTLSPGVISEPTLVF